MNRAKRKSATLSQCACPSCEPSAKQKRKQTCNMALEPSSYPTVDTTELMSGKPQKTRNKQRAKKANMSRLEIDQKLKIMADSNAKKQHVSKQELPQQHIIPEVPSFTEDGDDGIQPFPLAHNQCHQNIAMEESEISASSSNSDTDSEDENAFNQITKEHSRQIMGGNGMVYVEPISTPIHTQIPSKLHKKIWRNKFVDFASLLPSLHSNISHHHPQFSLQMDSQSNISIVPQQKIRKIEHIEQWTTAFLRFVAIYSQKHPLQTPQLMKYGEIVRDLAQRRASWAFYDTQFRMLRESMIIPWDRIHTEFWIMSTTQPTTQSFRPFRPSHTKHNRNGPHNRSGRFLQNTCWVFNRRTQCHNQQCPHPHVCGYCRGAHSAPKCSYHSKEQAAQSQSVPSTSSISSPPAGTTPRTNKK